jgi:serine/threonine-protein kinase
MRELVREACRAANWTVYTTGLGATPPQRMGATLAIAAFCQDEVIVGNVGDSRVYQIRGRDVRLLSVDHSLAGVQRHFGLITDEQARASTERHVLTRSLGYEAEAQPDFGGAMLAPGDRVLLCTDGLHCAVNDRELGEIVSQAPPIEACRRLVALARHRAGEDDISAQIIEVVALRDEAGKMPRPATATSSFLLPALDPQPGHTLDDRFLLTEVIARSGMATIFQAVDLETHETVAVKVPFAQYRSRLQHEADILRQLGHRYVLRFVAAGLKPGREYLVTEYLRGYTLAHLLRNVCPLPEDEARKIGGRVCEALDHLHQRGLLHRDIKPHNVMLCHDDTLRLLDFGLCGPVKARTGFFQRFTPQPGTPDYMAPEQVQGKACDARADLFSVGVMLYEMLTGAMPFAGETPKAVMQARLHADAPPVRQRNPLVSTRLEAILQRALARQPADRYPSAPELRTALAAPSSAKG